jgi:eukaryotic-like serine/threonine-protein kinase
MARAPGDDRAQVALDQTVAAGSGEPGLDATVAAVSGEPGLDATVAADVAGTGAGGAASTFAAGLDATVAAAATAPAIDLPGGTLSRSIAAASKSGTTLRSEPLNRGDTLGRYVVLARLGAGGMGEVYTAYDPELDRRIALKVIRPMPGEGSTHSAQVRLLDEARALARLSHPNVVAIHDVGVFEGDVFLAMEFVEGETLTAWLEGGERSWRDVVDVVVAAGRGLEAAHAAGLIHRDVKPDNIIIGKDGRVRVLDFGVAMSARTAPVAARGTESSLVGTPAYMAPEQFSGEDVGPYTDQFSLGVTLYQALWKQRPFAGSSIVELAANVTEGEPAPPPVGEVPAFVRAAVMRALAREPAARHPSLSAMLAALVPPTRRSTWPWLAAGAAAVAVAAAVVVATGSRAGAPACTGFEHALAGVWDPARKAAVAAAITQDGEAAAIVQVVDRYASDWIARKTDACRATHVTRAQSVTVLERRMACLDTRRRELDAVLAVLVAADRDGKRGGIESVTGLSPISQCDNLAALAAGGAPAAVAADEVRALEEGLARIRALRLAGDYKTLRAEVPALIARADAAGWGALAAAVLVERGRAEGFDGDPKTARETLFEAIRRAAQAEDAASEASAWIELVGVEAGRLRQPTEALRWAKHAEIALARAGGDQAQRAQLLVHTGGALRQLDRGDEGLALMLEARTLLTHALGARHYRVAFATAAIGTAYRALGQHERAIAEGEVALAQLSELLGERHPLLGASLNNLALAYDDADRLDDARALLERALELKEAELGPTHVSLAPTLVNLANFDSRAGRFEEAEQRWRRAYELRVATLGDRHADVTRMLAGRVIELAGRGLDREALSMSRDVVARLRGLADAPDLPTALAVKCELERRTDRHDAAARSCAEAMQVVAASADPQRVVYVASYAARTAVARKELAEARAAIDRAKDALGQLKRDVRLATAQVSWAAAHVALAEGRRDEALAEARAARESFATRAAVRSYYLEDLERTFGP